MSHLSRISPCKRVEKALSHSPSASSASKKWTFPKAWKWSVRHHVKVRVRWCLPWLNLSAKKESELLEHKSPWVFKIDEHTTGRSIWVRCPLERPGKTESRLHGRLQVFILNKNHISVHITLGTCLVFEYFGQEHWSINFFPTLFYERWEKRWKCKGGKIFFFQTEIGRAQRPTLQGWAR